MMTRLRGLDNIFSVSARCAGLAVLLGLAAGPLHGQTAATAIRGDGHQTPLMVYESGKSVCAPLAVISHGAGGSERGYGYLAQGMEAQGFTAVVMGHSESGLAALRGDMRAKGLMKGVQELVADPNAETARLNDVTATLKWAEARCSKTGGRIPFRVLLGHSMGAETVMLEAGAKNMIGVTAPPAGQNRFDAYVALSPEGPGIVFPEGAWSQIRKPMLVLTGTRDQSLKGGPEARQIPWKEMPGRGDDCQWMGVIDGATHMNFGGGGMGVEQVTPVVTSTIASFLRGVRGGACVLPSAAPGLRLSAK